MQRKTGIIYLEIAKYSFAEAGDLHLLLTILTKVLETLVVVPRAFTKTRWSFDKEI